MVGDFFVRSKNVYAGKFGAKGLWVITSLFCFGAIEQCLYLVYLSGSLNNIISIIYL